MELSAPSREGLYTRPAETLLTSRAADFLAAGSATAAELVAHVCQLPAVPGPVAEHMAAALFAGRAEFVREADGRWRRASDATPAPPPPPADWYSLRAPTAPASVCERPAPAPQPPPNEPAEPHPLSLTYTVVDVETTGTSPERGHRVTEIAAVRVENGEIRDVFQTLVNPERPIPPFIMALTGISWEMVRDAPRFRDVCDELLARMEGTIFVAHNASFDWKFVAAEVERATSRRLDGRRLCTVRLARAVLPQLRRKSLDWVADHYGVQIEGRHRAGGDALATAHCLIRMLRAASDSGHATLDAVDRLCGTSRARPRRSRPSAMPGPVWRDTTA